MEGAPTLFFAGGLAGAVEVCAVQPLDMLKTRAQLSSGRSVGIFAHLNEVVAEGGVVLLYRGLVPELLCGVPKSSVMFAAYASARRLIARARGGLDDCATSFLAGAISGVPEAVVMTPFQVVKVRLQSKRHTGLYKHALHCVREMVASEGVASLATGLYVTVARNSIWNAVYFAAFRLLTPSVDANRSASGRLHAAACGFVAGIFATCFNCPFDVVKSRMQAELSVPRATIGGAPGRGAGISGGVVSRLVTIAREEGVRALWKGFVAKSLRMGLGGAVGLATFELACDMLAVRAR